jgi:hypothetical protein
MRISAVVISHKKPVAAGVATKDELPREIRFMFDDENKIPVCNNGGGHKSARFRAERRGGGRHHDLFHSQATSANNDWKQLNVAQIPLWPPSARFAPGGHHQPGHPAGTNRGNFA